MWQISFQWEDLVWVASFLTQNCSSLFLSGSCTFQMPTLYIVAERRATARTTDLLSHAAFRQKKVVRGLVTLTERSTNKTKTPQKKVKPFQTVEEPPTRSQRSKSKICMDSVQILAFTKTATILNQFQMPTSCVVFADRRAPRQQIVEPSMVKLYKPSFARYKRCNDEQTSRVFQSSG